MACLILSLSLSSWIPNSMRTNTTLAAFFCWWEVILVCFLNSARERERTFDKQQCGQCDKQNYFPKPFPLSLYSSHKYARHISGIIFLLLLLLLTRSHHHHLYHFLAGLIVRTYNNTKLRTRLRPSSQNERIRIWDRKERYKVGLYYYYCYSFRLLLLLLLLLNRG